MKHDQFLSILIFFFFLKIRWEGLFLYKRINKLVSIRLNEFLSFVLPHEVFVIILKSQKKKRGKNQYCSFSVCFYSK